MFHVCSVIFSIYFIDCESDSGIPFLEYNSPHPSSFKVDSEILSKFFNHVDFTLETIKKTLSYGQNLSDTTRILLIKNMNIIIHYCSKCHTLVCSIADADDNNDKILRALITLANRFSQKHRADLDEFRISNQHEIFSSFQIDIENFTMQGKIGESFPTLIVNGLTLERLRKMAVIKAHPNPYILYGYKPVNTTVFYKKIDLFAS